MSAIKKPPVKDYCEGLPKTERLSMPSLRVRLAVCLHRGPPANTSRFVLGPIFRSRARTHGHRHTGRSALLGAPCCGQYITVDNFLIPLRSLKPGAKTYLPGPLIKLSHPFNLGLSGNSQWRNIAASSRSVRATVQPSISSLCMA